MLIHRGHIYLEEAHIDELRSEPEYVKRRYEAIASTVCSWRLRITRKEAARILGLSKRQVQRIVKRFKKYGIPGLRFRSRRPKTSPNRTPAFIEEQIIAAREATGFGPIPLCSLVNESLRRQKIERRVYPSLVDNILVRTGLIEREKKLHTEYKSFEWGHPGHLIQADLTMFNGVTILTMEDDYSRKGWSTVLKDQRDITVEKGMRRLVKERYENLLTDNGSQFSRKNSVIRKYCEKCIDGKHIWTSIHHPQTMGKLSAYQKGMKRYLIHRLERSRDRRKIERELKIYNHYYNNGKFHSVIQCCPEDRYSGESDDQWYDTIVKSLKLDGILCCAKARG